MTLANDQCRFPFEFVIMSCIELVAYNYVLSITSIVHIIVL